MLKRTDFVYSQECEPHRVRTKQILKQHPEMRKLIGKNWTTIFAIVGIVGLQVVLAWFVSDKSWWIVVGAAYLIGAFADHALFVMIHECAHHLLFKNRSANRLAVFLQIFRNFFQALFLLSVIISSTILFKACMNWMQICQTVGKQN